MPAPRPNWSAWAIPHGGRGLTQEEVNRRMIAAAREGKTVVRLKSGDPNLFGRGAEEIGELIAAGIPYEVVPGVTAALAAASHAGISLTHREHASAVALVTGHRRRPSVLGTRNSILKPWPVSPARSYFTWA